MGSVSYYFMKCHCIKLMWHSAGHP